MNPTQTRKKGLYLVGQLSRYIGRSGMALGGQRRIEVAADALRKVICEETEMVPGEAEPAATPEPAPAATSSVAEDDDGGE